MDYRILTDAQGSVRLVVNAATGEIVQRMDYDAFGVVMLNTNPGFQPFGYAGGLTDGATGLVHFGAREYDPAAGRWTSRDPVSFGAGLTNLYAYVGNDPVNNIDPSGLWTDAQYVAHYFNGKGAPVNLADVGDLPRVREASAAAMNQFQHAVTLAAQAAAQETADAGLDSFSGSKDSKKSMNYKPVLFSLGGSMLQMKSTFEGTIDWTTCTFKFKVHLSFSIRDMFKDPADIFNKFKKDVEIPGGTPYQMNADWAKDYTGGGKVQ